MKWICSLLVFWVFFTNISMGQNTQPNYSDQVLDRFYDRVMRIPQEKLYLQTDKPYYSAGEEIWFKGYLLNAITHEPTAQSRFIYVELINKTDSVIERVKIQKDSLGFAGNLKLSPEIPLGHYTLRAYSYWMRNAGADFFFSKDVLIGNPIDDAVNGSISYRKAANGMVIATIRFTNASKEPITNRKMASILYGVGKKRLKASGVTDSDGTVSFPMKVDTSTASKKYLEVFFADKKSKYNQRFVLPSFLEDFDVQFFPEGGTLLANCAQTVAFKAVGSNGMSVDVSGQVTDSQGEELFPFQSRHKGMGVLMLLPQPGKTYEVHVRTATGLEKTYHLGPASPEGVVLQLKHNHTKIIYEVTNRTQLANQNLCLLIHSRGRVMAIKQLDSLSMSGQIAESLLPAGIVTFSVINQLTNETLSERLSFVMPSLVQKMEMTPDKSSYGPRDNVALNFHLLDQDSIPVKGNFSLSVTDSHSVLQDSLSDNILSNLLLTSDLKGHIEDPGGYFLRNDLNTRENLDLLMMTQGWRRFNTTDILRGERVKPPYYLEFGQALSGKVINLFNKPSKNVDIIVFSLNNDHFTKFTTTDSLGKYLIDGIRFPDSTCIVVKAKKHQLIGDVEVIPDPDDFDQNYPFIPSADQGEDAGLNDYFIQSKEKYFNDGGMPVVNLKEVTVTAEKKKNPSGDNYYSGMADNSIGVDKLDKMHMNVLTILMTIPGVRVSGDQISIRGNTGPPLILIDNMEAMDTQELSFLTSDDVEDISVFKGPSASIFGMRGGNGVISVTLRKGINVKSSPQTSLACIYPLGYQKPSEFYVPKYDVDSIYKDSKPDLRTTVYWNPSLSSDAQGNFQARFPTADKENNYNITLEGVSEAGEIYRYTGIIRRRNK